MNSIVNTTSDLHLERKVFHMTSIFAIFLCMAFLPPSLCWTIYFLFGVPSILLDFFRLRNPSLNKKVLKVMEKITRQSEINKMAGSSFTIIGVGIVYLFLPKNAAMLATLFLAFGDPLASFFGLLYGTKKIWKKKSWVGTSAAFVVCALLTSLFFYLFESEWVAWPLLLTGGLIGAVAELVPLGSLDDNLSQPLISGFLLTLCFSMSGGWF